MQKREIAIKTKSGIIIYKTKRKNYWAVELPDGTGWYGGINTPKLQSFIYYLGVGFKIELASKFAGFGRKVLKIKRKEVVVL